MSSGVILKSEIHEYIRHSERTAKRITRRPDFPRPRDLSGTGRNLVYIKAEVDAWLVGHPPAEKRPEPPQLRAGLLRRKAKLAAQAMQEPVTA